VFGEEVKQPAQVTTTERVSFATGGTIRITGSYGDLNVEGWDQPAVEITVIKSMPYDFKRQHPEAATQRLDRVRVVTQRGSDTELTISTVVPSRDKPFGGGADFRPESLVLPHSNKGGVSLEYQIHAPRDSKLVIHHGTGSVSVAGVTGDIEATCGRGDILLWLPPGSDAPGSYAIDAKVKFGHVSSELEGAALNQFLIGQRFERTNPPPSRRLYLRMGFGGITIKEIPHEAIGPVAANVK